MADKIQSIAGGQEKLGKITSSHTPELSHYKLLWVKYFNDKSDARCSNNPITAIYPYPFRRRTQIGHLHIGRPRSIFSSISFKIFPTVYAEEVKQTPVDDEHSRVPQLHVSEDDIEAILAKETGRDRLNLMFTKRGKHFGPDLELVLAGTQACTVISFIVYSFLGGFVGREEFIKNNKHTKFPSKFRAMRMYNDSIILGGLKFGGLWALKTGFFTGSFMLVSQSIAVYRNKSSPFEYIFAGAFTGGCMRLNLGLRGLIGGGIIGAFFGAIGGSLIYAAVWFNNETQEQRHYWEIHDNLKNDKAMEKLQAGSKQIAVNPIVPQGN